MMKSLLVKRILAILIMIIAVLPIACKKDSNDLNIDDRAINKTSVATASGDNFVGIDSIDIDADGLIDMIFQHGVSASDSIELLVFQFRNANVLSENIDILGDTVPTTKLLSLGTSIDASSTIWQQTAYSSYISKSIGHLADFGIHGKGDQFLAFQLKRSVGNYLYGWMKVNLSNDSKTLIIKELAVQKVINKAIKIGEK